MTRQPAIGSALGLTTEQAVGDGARIVALRHLREGLTRELHHAIDELAGGSTPVDVAIRLEIALRRLRDEWGS